MRVVLTCLLLLSTASAAAADECGDRNLSIRQANQRYVSVLNEAKGLQANLGSATHNAEAALRAVRGYGLAIRDLREKRAGIVAIYRSLVDQGCDPFDEKGLMQTRDEFRYYSEEEDRIYAAAQQYLATKATRGAALTGDP